MINSRLFRDTEKQRHRGYSRLLVCFALFAFFVFSAFSFSTAQIKHKVKDKALDEVSGIAASRTNPGLYYVHNDSGGKNEVYVLNAKGKKVHTIVLNGAVNRDWEDIAVGPGPAGYANYIYVGEIGDNKAQYPDITLYRYPEPNFALREIRKREPGEAPVVVPLSVIFEESAKDCETLMVDPLNGDVYLVSKREQKVGLYQIKAPLADTGINVARRILDLDFALATGGDISPQRDKVIIKNYDKVFCWSVKPAQEIKDALSQPPTELPYIVEPQGEAICCSANGKSYLTISEKAKKQPLFLYQYKYEDKP
jgi:hypothetical protein